MHENNVGLMCSVAAQGQEGYHLGLELTALPGVFIFGKQTTCTSPFDFREVVFLPLRIWQHNFKAVVSGSVSKVECSGNDRAKWDKFSNFSFPFREVPQRRHQVCMCLTYILVWIYWLLCFKNMSWELRRPVPCSDPDCRYECNMTKANSTTHQAFCGGSIVL